MDRVTVVTSNVVQGMLRPANIRTRKILCVAIEAILDRLARLHQRKCVRNGGLAAARFDVLFRGPVTALASGVFRRLFTGGDAFEMRIPEEREPDIGMA